MLPGDATVGSVFGANFPCLDADLWSMGTNILKAGNLSVVQDTSPPARWTVTDYNGTSYDGDVSGLGVSQLQPTSTGASRSLAVSLAGTTTPGVFLAPVDDDVNPDNADAAVADGGLSKVHAVTPNLVYEYYTPRNFSLLPVLPTT